MIFDPRLTRTKLAGGCASHETLQSYLRADADITYEVVSRPTWRLRRREGWP